MGDLKHMKHLPSDDSTLLKMECYIHLQVRLSNQLIYCFCDQFELHTLFFTDLG